MVKPNLFARSRYFEPTNTKTGSHEFLASVQAQLDWEAQFKGSGTHLNRWVRVIMDAATDLGEIAINPLFTERQTLRQELLKKRQSLSEDEQKHAAQNLLNQLKSIKLLDSCHIIAGYIANRGETDLSPCATWLSQAGKKYYLPVIHPHRPRSLWFAPYSPQTPLFKNRFHIFEPQYRAQDLLAPWEIDIVLCPLVGFDPRGHRLGMGQGYYDDSFKFLTENQGHRPYLIGCGHDCQEAQFETEDWDIPMDLILTPSRIILPKNGSI